jgi:hypothetical protein
VVLSLVLAVIIGWEVVEEPTSAAVRRVVEASVSAVERGEGETALRAARQRATTGTPPVRRLAALEVGVLLRLQYECR